MARQFVELCGAGIINRWAGVGVARSCTEDQCRGRKYRRRWTFDFKVVALHILVSMHSIHSSTVQPEDRGAWLSDAMKVMIKCFHVSLA